jgi:hypothetical protein
MGDDRLRSDSFTARRAAQALREAAEGTYQPGQRPQDWAAAVVDTLPADLHAAALAEVLPDWFDAETERFLAQLILGPR